MSEVHGEGRPENGTLYVVATPIGNLEDITLRALKVLAEADIVAAEDTRNTAILLARHAISKRPVALHEHNEAAMAGKLVHWLREGRRVALVSDAGTPGLSDPGARVVASVRQAGLRVVPIPGPNAAVSAFCASGIPDGRFLYYGYLPARSAARRAAIAGLAALDCALVFYEAPHRILEAVDDLAGTLAEGRTIVIARELTKVYESIERMPLREASEWLRADSNRQRGEFVLIVSGASKQARTKGNEWERILDLLLSELPLAQAVRLTCAATGAKRKAVYERALAAVATANKKE
ncbi:MAG: 16S rRNA (cytidine(1402)-2'-O)-methyltransferase [Betaproteobacteria bacterium RIFCSPLOWO2_12_FULL_63_13]|nr:MAG: 16S rRNA (cytidine(1402)-2'-O)-methyltransferase [Betaproteobacteria bacterium RIFCSPLOWO2_12_FULL_63_13]